MMTTLSLISTALEEVAFGLDAFSFVEVELLTAFTAEEITCILVHIALLIGAFATFEVSLYRVEQLSADDGFVRIMEGQHLVGAILQSFFELIGF